MNSLTTYQQNLPDTIEDVAKFLLIAPEKAKALRAEIRAIENLRLAQEVYDQKMDEQRQLAELILDASVKLGEFTKAIPKATNGGANQYVAKPTAVSGNQKTKTEAIKDLGFTPKQVERFETLASNKDLVEQVKAESRESGTIPTRTKILDLAQERKKKQDAEFIQVDTDYDNLRKFRKALDYSDLYAISEETLDSVARVDENLPDTISELNKCIEFLNIIKNKLILKGANYGKTERGQ